MSRLAPSRRSLPVLAAAVGALALLGVVMADSHDPVAVEPDAKLAAGRQVATFALG